MSAVGNFWRRVTEQIYISAWGPWSWSGLRSRFKIIGMKFFGNGPSYENTLIKYDVARQMYRNDGCDMNLGSQFARPIVDLQVDFIGLPTATVEDEKTDDFLNACLHEFWAGEIQQFLRNAIRDSKTVVRIHQDDQTDKLTTAEEKIHCRLEVLIPEYVTCEYEIGNATHMTRAFIRHFVMMTEQEGDIQNGVLPIEREHEIIETITEESYEYYDKTDRVMMPELTKPNNWGFVPITEIENEYDSTLGGGQSDLEAVYPFIRAFHDALTQALKAHKYHSIPKVTFKLNEIQSFIANNYPDVIDPATGQIRSGASISWQGREVFFIKPDEDMNFLEAQSILGDSKTLLEFLVDCISVASETPKWAFSIVDAGSANQADNAQSLPWTKKIIRKRTYYEAPIQRLLKMVMAINGFTISRPKIRWEITRVADQVAFTQALQMLIMGLEVAAQRGIISDTTYREMLRQFIPVMKNPSQEEKDAESNFVPLPPAPAAPANNPSSNGKGNSANVPVVAGQQGKNE